MLSKKHRANTKDVSEVFKKSFFLSSPNLTFRYFKNTSKETKISFIAPKSVAKLAVNRNLLRRSGYNALKKCLNLCPVGVTGIFSFKKYQSDVAILENEIKNILTKVN